MPCPYNANADVSCIPECDHDGDVMRGHRNGAGIPRAVQRDDDVFYNILVLIHHIDNDLIQFVSLVGNDGYCYDVACE
jgi:hypothetical protein